MRHIPCILITIGAILAAELAVAPYLLLLTYGAASAAQVGEMIGIMMVPASMLCVFALFRYTTVFAGLALFGCSGYAYFLHAGLRAEQAPDGVAMFHVISVLAGSVAAATVIALRMKGRWKY